MGEAVDHEESDDARPDSAGPEPHVALLRGALIRYELSGSPAMLDEAFAAAAAAVALLRGERGHEPADAAEVRSLMARLPEFDQLVSAAVGEAERSVHAEASQLWEWFGLRSVPPEWDQAERSGARVLVACACAPLDRRGAGWLRPRLLRLAAPRWARLLTGELRAGDDRLWQLALGERYESVRRRYAPRTKWRTRELSELLTSDESTVGALQQRLAHWLAEGGDVQGLPAELEAAFVQTRAPARLA